MAQLALGLAGAAAGSAFGPLGAQIGWMLGAAVGGLLFPEKVQGPRLDDLKLHNSSYGNMTPFVYGTMRVAGNIIDEQPELTEVSDTSGGKGGPEVTSYTYTCSFAVRLCEGPIKGIIRIWANGRLIYDHTGNSVIDNDLPMTIYLGTEEQLPDPTLETLHGAGNVPGYRGIAYVVFTDLLLTEFGNTLPVLNFEVFTAGGDIPIRVSTWNTTTLNGDGGVECAEWDAESELILMGGYTTAGGHGGDYAEQAYDLDGNAVGSPTTLSMPNTYGPRLCVVNNLRVMATYTLAGAAAAWYVNGVEASTITGLTTADVPGPSTCIGMYQDGYIYTTCVDVAGGGHAGVVRWGAPDGIPGGTYDAVNNFVLAGVSAGNITIQGSDAALIYVVVNNGDGTLTVYECDAELQPTGNGPWNTGSDIPASGIGETYRGGSFFNYGGMFVTNFESSTEFRMNLLNLSGDSSSTITLYPQERGASDDPSFVWHGGNFARLYGGYFLGKDGVVLLDAPPGPVLLSEIVADLSERSGLDATHYDVDELTDLVDGYLVSQQATGRDMIQPLRDGYFFDGVERDNQVVFVKRGHDAVVAIPDDELAAHGEQVPPIVGTVRAQEVDLPCVVNVDYVNFAADYQTGTQAARRQVTQSQSEVSLTIPVSMSDEKAKAIADTQLYIAWMERNRFSFFTSRKYAAYEPTDVVTVGTRDVRLVEKTETRPGVVKWDAVEAIAEVLLQAGGAVSVDFVPSPPGGVVVIGDTTLYLFDLPLIAEGDDPDGIYAGMAWDHGAGAGLFKSADGVAYASIASTTVPAVIGVTSDALGDFGGGNTFDEANAVDVVTIDAGELASTTEEAVLNGANLAVIGDEVLQFKGAELVDVDTYRLTGLLRGRFGTEWAMAGHGEGEEFALLPLLRAPAPHAELHQLRAYKGVTFTKALADADAHNFTNNGVAWQPYAPVLLGGGTNGAGDVTLNLTRRTRIGGGWAPYTDVPIGEASERYVWQIWNAAYSKVARIIETTTPTTTYTSAQQVTDFGAQQQTIYFTAAQVGSIGIGRQARGHAPGAGGSNGDPLSAIPPYQSPTSGSSTPPAPFDAINMTITWGALGSGNVRVNSAAHGDFDCSKVLVATFTTPSTTAANAIGRIQAVESVDGPVARTACLSRVAGDFSGTDLGAGSLVQSSSATVQFSVGTNTSGRLQLAASTTYYYNIRNDDGHGVCTCFTGDCSMFVELAKPPGL